MTNNKPEVDLDAIIKQINSVTKKRNNTEGYIGLSFSGSVKEAMTQTTNLTPLEEAAFEFLIQKMKEGYVSPWSESADSYAIGGIPHRCRDWIAKTMVAWQAQQPGLKWVKASERLPDGGGDTIWRFIGQTNIVGCSYKVAYGFLLPNYRPYPDQGMIEHKEFDKIEWLDESAAAPIKQSGGKP